MGTPRPHLSRHVSGRAPRRGRRPRRPVARSFHASGGNIPRSRARVTFGRSPKSDQKRCLKPQVSRLPARLGCAENRGRVLRENQDSADRRTTNRVRPSCRCRSCVPCGGALVCRFGRKAAAPEREMFLWQENEEWAAGPAGGYVCGWRTMGPCCFSYAAIQSRIRILIWLLAEPLVIGHDVQFIQHSVINADRKTFDSHKITP